MPIPTPPIEIRDISPVPTLVGRVRSELSADFAASRPLRVSRAPGRLDVMGGIAEHTGSLVCQLPLDRAAAVAIQPRDDRWVQVCSFNLFDDHRPFTLRVPLDALATHAADDLRRDFAEPGRRWAAYLAGCLFALHEQQFVNLRDPSVRGVNLALYSTVPAGAGLSASAAITVAAMLNLADHFDVRRGSLTGERLAELCQLVERRIAGSPCGIKDPMTSCLGEAGQMLRMVCQPSELRPPLALPEGVRVLGIDSKVRQESDSPAYRHARCAASIGHRLILEAIRRLGEVAGRELIGDPMRGYLANLDPDNYKALFRSSVPEWMTGREFVDQYGATSAWATEVEPDVRYAVRHATDHHVLEARRVRRFAAFIEQSHGAAAVAGSARRGSMLDRAGHLMYASHQSYAQDAMLGAPECDLLVDLVRRRERAGLYGARITGRGEGGTVAVLASAGEAADAGIAEIIAEYERRTGRTPEVFAGTSPGAWQAGTSML